MNGPSDLMEGAFALASCIVVSIGSYAAVAQAIGLVP